MTSAFPSTAREIRDAVSSRRVSAVEICRQYLDRIERYDGRLGAFRTVAAERAIEEASEVDRRNTSLPLAGVPVAVKDNLCTRGLTSTASSRILDGYVPPY
ncbi:MAG: amidase family protein, partial [Vicinamibacterales bacterium]